MSKKKIIKALVAALEEAEAHVQESIQMWEGRDKMILQDQKLLNKIRRATVLGKAAA